jgi:hypothetical protein
VISPTLEKKQAAMRKRIADAGGSVLYDHRHTLPERERRRKEREQKKYVARKRRREARLREKYLAAERVRRWRDRQSKLKFSEQAALSREANKWWDFSAKRKQRDQKSAGEQS